VNVIGLSGTPYIKNEIKVGKSSIKLNQIQDIVYDYSLSTGIGRFLKNPDVICLDRKESTFINNALTAFFKDYDITYENGTKSKIAFYCPSIKKLNEGKGFRGSSNQVVQIYNPNYDYLRQILEFGSRKAEIEVGLNQVRIIGIPPKSLDHNRLS